ncbi:unnamed protein product [Mytilus edulis]|uniref:AIG1-type G domain-containing protein n=1 Tax=Mytilus edulis TaxID=6550 RepID=A0A8S3Q3G9_MYTED|nr:unnamed protein product [Mytilus edulis]
MKAEMENSIRLSLPGPHVFLYVISIGGFTKEDLNSIKTFKTKFGRDVHKYYLLILTRFDDYKRDNDVDILDFESLKDNITSEWRTLLNQTFEDRIFPFDNTLSGKASLEQVTMLLHKIDDIISVNDGNIYTNADFNRAKQLIKKEQQRELDDQDRVQKAKRARIILEVEKANKKLLKTLAEQHAKDELEKQALQERQNVKENKRKKN